MAGNDRTTAIARAAQNGAKGRGPNKTTIRAREAIAMLVEETAPMMHKWLLEIYEQDGPKVAFQCLERLLDYHIPRLSRQEHVGENSIASVLATLQDLQGQALANELQRRKDEQ